MPSSSDVLAELRALLFGETIMQSGRGAAASIARHRASGTSAAVAAYVRRAKPPVPVRDLVTLAVASDDPAKRLVLLEAALERRDDCAEIQLTPDHVAALTNDPARLTGGTAGRLKVYGGNTPLGLAVERGHREVVAALIARGALGDDAPDALDTAVRHGHDEIAALLIGHGVTPTVRTASQLSCESTDELLDALVAAGLPLADPDVGVDYDAPSTEARLAHLRRLIARGLVFDAARLRTLIEDLREEDRPDAVPIIELARSRGVVPDAELVTFALDELPLDALVALAAAGAPIRASARVKSSAPEAARKRAWLAARAASPAGTIPWDEFARLDGADLTPELLCERLVGDRVFPGLELEGEHHFESELIDTDHPATHRLSGGEAIEYTVIYWSLGHEHDHEGRAKTAFTALVKAISKLHGKPSGTARSKVWQLADREVLLSLTSDRGRGTRDPSAQVTLWLRR